MKELVATIHFIGLALFSAQVPGSTGLHVLLPRAEAHSHGSPAVVQSKTVATKPAPAPTIVADRPGDIEPHEVYIIYDRNDFVSEGRWVSQNLPSHMIRNGTPKPPQYRFVRVSGERVAFSASKASPSTDQTILALPRPKCGESTAKPDAVALRNVNHAAAVIAIPRGRLTSCGARFDRERRYDTQLEVSNPKELVITAVAPDSTIKWLTLKGNATVYVTNIPAAMLKTPNWTASGAQHYLAYYELIKTPCSEQGLTAPRASLTTCAAKPLWLTGQGPAPLIASIGAGRERTPGVTSVVDSACSNSAWP